MDVKKAIEEMKSLSPSENAIETILQALENSIPKKKIEDKIKELKRLKENPKEAEHYVAWYSRRIEYLQELLEDKSYE